MNGGALRPDRVAIAAIVLGGALAIVAPQHGGTIVRLVIATGAAAAALYAFVINAPPSWWHSPFDRSDARRNGALERDRLGWVRASLGSRRQRIARNVALPPETLRALKPVIAAALERAGTSPGDPAQRDAARAMLSPLARAILDAAPLEAPGWFRTTHADQRSTARIVHAVLDELDRLAAGTHATSTPHTTP